MLLCGLKPGSGTAPSEPLGHSHVIFFSSLLACLESLSLYDQNKDKNHKNLNESSGTPACETFRCPGFDLPSRRIWLDQPTRPLEGGELPLRKDGDFRELKPGPHRRLGLRCSHKVPQGAGATGPGRAAPRLPLPLAAPTRRPPAANAIALTDGRCANRYVRGDKSGSRVKAPAPACAPHPLGSRGSTPELGGGQGGEE